MAQVIVWGTVNADGEPVSGSGYTSNRTATGTYTIDFDASFATVPAIVGSQVQYESTKQNTLDNVVFPFLTSGNAQALTGDSNGKRKDRIFSFIAVGDAP